MGSFLLVFFLVGILFHLALIYESMSFALLGFTTVIFAVLSFVVLFLQSGRVKVKLGIPMKIVDKGQVFGLQLKAWTDASLPIGKLQVLLTYGERGSNRREKLLEALECEGESGEKFKKLSIETAGCYEFSVGRIRIYDPFGFFYISRKGKSMAQVMVMPALTEIPVRLGEAVKNFYGETVEYDDFLAGQDASEVFDVREFRDGDKLQRIHWKLSARTDELMVKEDSLPKACAIVLFMPEGKLSESHGLDFMASLSFSLMDAKCAHYMVWHSLSRGDLVRVRITDDESFYLALTAFLQDGATKCEGDRLERYREKYKGEQFLHSVWADEAGNVWMDGEASFPAQEPKEVFFK